MCPAASEERPLLTAVATSYVEDLEGECRRARAMIEHSADVVARVDAQGVLLSANPAAETLLGWRVADFVGRCLLELVHPSDLARVKQALADAVRTPGPHPEVVFRLASARRGWVLVASTSTNLLSDSEVTAIVVNARDASRTFEDLDALVGVLSRASEVRDPNTAGHQRGVAEMSERICQLMTLTYEETERIRLGAALHDIGKIAIPGEILAKPGRLSEAEWLMVKSHPVVGHEIVSSASMAGPIADIVLHHHERLDGSGYPHGLSGGEIKIGARIVAVADTVDAICSNRPYRPALGPGVAREVVVAGRGRTFAADVVDAALAVMSERGSSTPPGAVPRSRSPRLSS
jgi:PAS domain S-box-containing protein/putative nucleotidyltransferase with HDIG domain